MSKKSKKVKGQQPNQQERIAKSFEEMAAIIEADAKESEERSKRTAASQTFLPTEKTIVSDVTVTLINEDKIKDDIISGCEEMVKELIKKEILTEDNKNNFWTQGPFNKLYGRYAKVCKIENLLEKYPEWKEYIRDTITPCSIYWVNKISEELSGKTPEVIPLIAPSPDEVKTSDDSFDLRAELHESVRTTENDKDATDILNVMFDPIDMNNLPPFLDKETTILWKKFIMFKVKVHSAYCRDNNVKVTDEYFQNYLVDLMESISPSGDECVEAAKELGVISGTPKEIVDAGFCTAMRKKMRKECPDLFELLAIA